MKKINLKYLKDNINLKELIKKLDKLERSGNEDMIRNAVLDSYPDIGKISCENFFTINFLGKFNFKFG